jgi:hypothetical protein
MKKFIAALIACSMFATPVYAHHNNRGFNRGASTGDVIAGVVGGIILGAIISNASRDNRDDRRIRNEGVYVPSPPPVPEYYAYVRCHDEEVYDAYGRIYYRRICQR